MIVTKEQMIKLYRAYYGDTSDDVLTSGQNNVYNKKGKPCVTFLDELSRAPLDVRQSALQLVLEKQIHEHKLPTFNGLKTLIVAADNPSDVQEGQMDYQVDELDPALLDRFMELRVEPDVKGWLDWARKNNVNQMVRDFVAEYPNRLHWMPQDGGKGATPRSWTKLGRIMDNKDDIDPELLFPIIKGKIGSEIGSQFLSFMNKYNKIVKKDDIIELFNKVHKGDFEVTGKAIAELMEGQEAIQKTEMIHQLEGEVQLAFLYSLEVEIFTAFFKILKEDNNELWKSIVQLDKDKMDKKLLRRVQRLSE